MHPLPVLYDEIDARATALTQAREDWPCRKGCDDCCRNLSEVPRLPVVEWQRLEEAVAQLPAPAQEDIAQRLRAVADNAERIGPVVCPFLDLTRGACRVYQARPTVCRTYGFYRDHDGGRFCGKVEAAVGDDETLIWGNHEAVERRLQKIAGPSVPLADWLQQTEGAPTRSIADSPLLPRRAAQLCHDRTQDGVLVHRPPRP